MKILVCFKIIHDFEGITPSELCELCKGTLNLDFFKKKIGSYDEAALETGRRLSCSIGTHRPCRLYAVTVGSYSQHFARELYSVGFDHVVQIKYSDTSPSPEETASCLYDFVLENGPFQAVLTGTQAWPQDSGLTPYLLAKKMGVPVFSQVTGLDWEEGIRVQAKTDRGTMSCTVCSPAIYTIGDAKHPYLKIATLREKLQAGNRALRIEEPKKHPPSSLLGQTAKLLYEKQERRCHLIEGSTSEEKARNLWKEVTKLWNP